MKLKKLVIMFTCVASMALVASACSNSKKAETTTENKDSSKTDSSAAESSSAAVIEETEALTKPENYGEVKLGNYKGIKVAVADTTVTDAEIDAQINNILKSYPEKEEITDRPAEKGDTVNIELIIPAGEDPHLYTAKPEDNKKLQSADLVLYHGLHFEGKMVEALEKLGTAVSKNFPKDKIGQMDEDGEMVVDPHFWFDIDLYKLAVEEACDALSGLNPEQIFYFNQEDIDKVVFKGYTDLDEERFVELYKKWFEENKANLKIGKTH